MAFRQRIENDLEAICPVSQKIDLSKLEVADMSGAPHTDVPERNLLSAVLTRTVLDLRSPDKKTADDAYGFLLAECTTEDPFSFRWLCSQLDIDPDMFLERVLGPKALDLTAVWEPYQQKYKGGKRLPTKRVYHSMSLRSCDIELE